MKNFLPVLALLAFGTANAQNVGVGTNAPHPSAKLDISANADPSARGLLIPQMNLASASFPAPGPATSLLVYNTNASFGGGVGYFYNEGTPASPVWRRLTNGSNAVGSVAASAPITSSGGVNPTISIPQANGTTDGFLDAADWTAFNNKVSGVAASAPITSTGGVNPTIGIPQATAAVDGFLDNADWNTFNNKLTTVTTNPRLTGLGTSGNPLDMAIVGTAGTYTKVTTDAYGRVVSAGTLAPGDIPTGSGNYIQNQFASGQSGSFWIGGQGKFGNGTTVYGDRMEVREGVNGNGFAYIDFRGDDNFTDYGLRLIRGNTGANAVSELVHRGSGNLNITAQDNGVIALNTSNVERMRVSATQPFVGIGTNNPQHNLTLGSTGVVFGVENTAHFSAKNAAGNYEVYLFPRWSDNVMYMNYGANGFNIRNNASTPVMFMTNGGLVGIGTTAPVYTLDVNGSSRVVGGLSTQGTASTLYGSNASIFANLANANGGGIMISDDGGFVEYNDGPVTYVGSTGLRIAGNNGPNSNNAYLRINQLSGTGNRPVEADANGILRTRGKAFVFSQDRNTYFHDASNVGYRTTGAATGALSVEAGDVVYIKHTSKFRWTGGSGGDHPFYGIQVLGCGNPNITDFERIGTADDLPRGQYQVIATDYVWVATCTGNVQFQLFVNNNADADDNSEYRDIVLTATRY